ncbi:hypothetical protein C5E04_16525 [Pectobacterium parmentieri]|uniref:hypothetical protein n=1 Tax=Pectobacterium parmentieri TaxID=1905730 RepID=UPI000EB0A7C8|nr:hypothetical protein [Pectobacterium parmentieri]RKO80839.1 hypothetical protein C5E04_16525 [Pectobacterium parmentieri]
MNLYNQTLLNEFYSQSFSKEELIKRFDLECYSPAAFISKEIGIASKKENADELEDAITLVFIFNEKDVPVEQLNFLLLEHWHYKHEDIASLLQDIRSESSVECLFKAIQEDYKYLSFDDSYALAIKCIWALGGINNENAKSKLSELCQSDIAIIKSNAENQLARLAHS